MRSTARRGLVLLSLALLVFSLTAFAQEDPPVTYRLDLSTVEGQGEIERDPAGLEGAADVYYYFVTDGSPLDVTITAVPDEGWVFKEWQIGETGEDPDIRVENPTVVNFTPGSTDWTAVAVFEEEVEICHTVPSDWHFFGLPVDPVDTGFQALEFDPQPTDKHLFWWNPDAEEYVGRADVELRPMSGYWMFLTTEEAAYQVCIEGSRLSGDQVLELGAPGWQMISVPDYPVAWGPAAGGTLEVRSGAEVKSLQDAIDAMWVHHTLYSWDVEDKEWKTLRATDGATLEPWTGYFLFAHVGGLELLYSEDAQGQELWATGQALSAEALAFDPGTPPLPPMMTDAEPTAGLVAVAYPSPVRGEDVTFALQGPQAVSAQAMRVQVYDLSGQVLFRGEDAGTSLSWDTMTRTGDPVASGVYLYSVEAKLNGQWVSAGVDKLLIVR